MPITMFPNIPFDNSGSNFDPVRTALQLEQLKAARRENTNQDAIQQAANKSYVTQQTPDSTDTFGTGNPNSTYGGGINTSVDLDPDLYSKNLNTISPELGQKFDAGRLALQTASAELEKKQLDTQLEKAVMPYKLDLLKHQGVNEAYTYAEATNFQDPKGFMALFNKYMDNPEDRAVNVTPMKGGLLVTHADGTSVPLNGQAIKMLGVESGKKLEQYNQLTEWMINHQRQVSQDTINNAAPIRKEYLEDPNTKIFQQRGDAYVSILEANKAGEQAVKEHPKLPGARTQQDLGMTYGFIKLLDAMTGVREGEIAAVTNIPGVLNSFKNVYAELLAGGSLTETQRREILRTSDALYNGSREIHDKTVGPRYDSYAKAAGVPTNLVRAPISFEDRVSSLKSKSKSGSVEYSGYTFPNQAALDNYKKAAGITD